MNYELVKELKNAGFPQADYPRLGYHHDGRLCGGANGDCIEYDVPNLSELIEACGDEFHSLLRIQREEWQIVGPYRDKDETERRLINFNKTPEEAVARLWLSLNKK